MVVYSSILWYVIVCYSLLYFVIVCYSMLKSVMVYGISYAMLYSVKQCFVQVRFGLGRSDGLESLPYWLTVPGGSVPVCGSVRSYIA